MFLYSKTVRRGREYLNFFEQSEEKDLVTRDRERPRLKKKLNMSGWWNGIHRRLKISRRKAYGFESHPGHKINKRKAVAFRDYNFVVREGTRKPQAGTLCNHKVAEAGSRTLYIL